MDQELKQRLIGAVVITALAAIFVPMLFDDPIDDTGKSINELKIPELPSKVQDVEIMPLPEKVEDVAQASAAEESSNKGPARISDEEEAALEAPKPKTRLGARETAPIQRVVPQAPAIVPADAEEPVMAEAEDIPPPKPGKSALPTAQPQPPTTTNVAPKVLKPASKLPETKVDPAAVTQAPINKPIAADEANNRWYLQVGTFGQKPNAATLLDSLKQQGFAASIKEVATDKGTVFKVRIGPIVDKAKAQAVKAKLAQINVNSFVSADE